MKAQRGLRQRLRYRFDNLMARGVAAQILMLALITFTMVFVTATLVWVLGLAPPVGDSGHETFFQLVWRASMRTLDPGTMGSDTGPWTFLFLMLFITLGGVFVLSGLIGILNNGMGEVVDELRKGKSVVVEREHTVVLGYNPKIFTLLEQLAVANEHHRGACVVILADRDKVAMDDELRQKLGKRRLRVVTRSGNPLDLHDLELVSLSDAKSIVVLAPEQGDDDEPVDATEADAMVLKALLAITKAPHRAGEHFHIVAEIQSERTLSVARMVVGDRAALLLAPPLISRLLVQAGRQSGLSAVYTVLLQFEGSEVYMKVEPTLVGKTFREALRAYGGAAVMGVLGAGEELLLPPPMDRRLAAGDRVIAVSEELETMILGGTIPAADEAAISIDRTPHPHRAERTLVLGTSERLWICLRELDTYVAAGSEAVVVGESEECGARIEALAGGLAHMKVSFRPGDVTDRHALDDLDVPGFDHVLVLSETAGRHHELSDARTMITLLHLRDILRKSGKDVPITSEILEIRNRDLAMVAEPDDFIVSNTLVSLMMAQVSENKELVRVFDRLFHPVGHEIALHPAAWYVRDTEVTFATIVEAAARQGEVALGWRIGAQAHEASAQGGVVMNPAKSQRVRLGKADRVVVLTPE